MPTCAGLGVLQKIDPDLIVPDWGKSLNENPFNVMGWSNLEPGTQAGMFFQALSEKYGFSMDTPLNRLPKEALDVILYGQRGRAAEHPLHAPQRRFAHLLRAV